MPTESRQVGVVLVEQKVARMIRHDERESEAAEVEEVLDRVHRERRPRPRIVCGTKRTAMTRVSKRVVANPALRKLKKMRGIAVWRRTRLVVQRMHPAILTHPPHVLLPCHS